MERLKKMFKNTNQVLKNSDVDAVILNCGDKGSGKSSLDLWGGCYWEEELNQRQFTLDNTVYDPKAFLGRLHNASPYSLITGDEGIEIFFSRNAMTGANKKLAKAMAQARAGKNYLIMTNIPDIRMIEGYIRTGEATAVIRTVMKWCPEENRLLKGYVDVYNAEIYPR